MPTKQMIHADNLPEIPSEFIEPYLKRFMMMQLESLYLGLTTPDKVKRELKTIDYFIMCFGGLHSQLACSNEYHKIYGMTDETIKNIANEIFK